MTNRPAWKKVTGKRAQLTGEQGLQPNSMPECINSFEEYEDLIKAQAEKAGKA